VTYAELKAAVLEDAHRANLSSKVARFIRNAEGMIARRLVSSEQDATTTLTDADRADTETGIYTAPSGILVVRRITLNDVELVPQGPNAIRMRGGNQSPFYYCDLGTRIEVRGVPAEDAELELDYFGRFAALSGDSDTNVILTNHEALYMHGSLHYLYRFTQNMELAGEELAAFDNAVDALNEATARKLSAGAAPAYDFGGGGGY